MPFPTKAQLKYYEPEPLSDYQKTLSSPRIEAQVEENVKKNVILIDLTESDDEDSQCSQQLDETEIDYVSDADVLAAGAMLLNLKNRNPQPTTSRELSDIEFMNEPCEYVSQYSQQWPVAEADAEVLEAGAMLFNFKYQNQQQSSSGKYCTGSHTETTELFKVPIGKAPRAKRMKLIPPKKPDDFLMCCLRGLDARCRLPIGEEKMTLPYFETLVYCNMNLMVDESASHMKICDFHNKEIRTAASEKPIPSDGAFQVMNFDNQKAHSSPLPSFRSAFGRLRAFHASVSKYEEEFPPESVV